MATPLTVRLNEQTLRRLTEAAKRLGRPPEELASDLLMAAVAAQAPAGVAEPTSMWADEELAAAIETTPEDYEGPYVDLDDALDAFDAELNRRLASRAG